VDVVKPWGQKGKRRRIVEKNGVTTETVKGQQPYYTQGQHSVERETKKKEEEIEISR